MGLVKTCTKCGKTKPLTEFYKDWSGKNETKNICKECYKDYYTKNLAIKQERNKAYRERYEKRLKEQERKLEAVELLQASELLGGYRIYVLNHCKEGEVKYTCVKVSTAEVYRTNDKRKFLCYLEEVI